MWSSFAVAAHIQRRFEGDEALDALLRMAGSRLTTEQVRHAFRTARAEQQSPADVIPTLFPSEPRFVDPEIPPKLYGNLMGLWDIVHSKGAPRAPPGSVGNQLPERPPLYGLAGPDSEFVEVAWRYLQDLPEGARTRLEHRFENTQDALINFLDSSGLSDRAFGHVRYLVFELAAMIELGWPAGLRSVALTELERVNPPDYPGALVPYVEEALFEAEQDEGEPLTAEESRQAREIVNRCAGALWNARRERK